MRSATLILAIHLFLPHAAEALTPDRAISQYAHRSWRIEEGLPNSVVRGIVQTDDGYLWIATYEGLARYNGDTFTRFDKKALPALRRDTILTVMKARDGALWIGTNGGGAARFHRGVVQVVDRADGLPSDIVAAFAEASDGTVWMGTSAGLVSWRDDKVQKIFAEREGLTTSSVLSLAQLRDGTLFIGTRGDGVFSLRGNELKPVALPNRSVHALLVDAEDTLWIGAGGGLSRLTNGEVHHIDNLPSDQVTAVYRDSDRTLWVGTYASGLFRSADGINFTSLTNKEGLLNNSVRAIFEDKEKTLWVGTNGGLESFRAGRFITIGAPERLSDTYARTVFEDHAGNIWIGTARGLNRFSKDGHRVYTTADGLTNDHIFTIAETADRALWVGTPSGLHRLSGETFTLFAESSGLPSRSVRALLTDRSGTLWIGTDRGAATYRDGKFHRVVPGPRWEGAFVQALAQGPDGSVWLGADGRGIARYHDGAYQTWTTSEGLPDMHVLSLLINGDGVLWIGTDSTGLIRMKDGKFTHYDAAAGLPSEKILQLLADGEGRLWFGAGRGIWSAELRDLNEFPARKHRIAVTTFDAGDGMRSVQCNGSVYPSGFRSRDGRLWFPTVDGVATIDPRNSLSRDIAVAPVTIERVLVDDAVIDISKPVAIPPGAQQIEVHYAALTYVSPQQVEFRYKLEGYDDDWVRAGNRRVAYYTSVPPGNYSFHVVAANADGVWNRKGAALALSFQPRFYETRWFPLVIILLLIALIALFHTWRIRGMRAREMELVRLVDERTKDIQLALHEAETARERAESQERLLAKALDEAEAASRAKSTFLANMSHELRTPLNAIIGFAGVLQMNGADRLDEKQQRFVKNIAVSGEHLLALINDILDLAKVEAGKMTLEPMMFEVRREIESVLHGFRGLALTRSIEIDADVATDCGVIEADPLKLKQIIYNLLSNAVKFSPEHARVLLIARRLSSQDSPLGVESISISVVDHGVGIPESDQEAIFEEFRQIQMPGEKRPAGTGLGLALVKKFVALHGGAVTVSSELGKGSTFTVVLPTRVAPPSPSPSDVPESARAVVRNS